MPERLAAQSALGAALPRALGDSGTVMVAPMPQRGMLGVRLDPQAAGACARASEALGVELPLRANTRSVHGGRAALWLGPDEWLIVVPEGDEGSVSARLLEALAGMRCAVTDVSDLRAAFEVKGARARDLLAKGCAVDLHPRAFRPGDLALTALARVRVIICQTAQDPAYEILVERSYAGYLWHWLGDAATEFHV
jgi:sarcosine oxidase subunit gamma